LTDYETFMKESLPPNEHQELWEYFIYTDDARAFLKAAATQYGYDLSEGKVVDETGKGVQDKKELELVIRKAVQQAMSEKPIWRVQ